jgi:uncharacterized protein (DUF1330 family)
MVAYVIVDEEIIDPDLYEEYKVLSRAILPAFDGRLLVRGGKVETLDGDWAPSRLIMAEFPSFERAQEWAHSAEYAPAKAMLQKSVRARMIIVDGGDPA